MHAIFLCALCMCVCMFFHASRCVNQLTVYTVLLLPHEPSLRSLSFCYKYFCFALWLFKLNQYIIFIHTYLSNIETEIYGWKEP